MKLPLARPLLALCLPLTLCAAQPDASLPELLKRYPAADTNHDGVLTIEEAQAYAKTLRRGRNSGAADAKAATAQSAPRRARPAPTHADVSYGPHERHRLDLWLAPGAAPRPLVVFIHGGGFVNGSKDGAHPEMIKACLAAKVSYMAINYRFRPDAPIQDILRDCARSIQFVRSKAREYNLDPARIAAYGGSAGAGTSLWLASHPDLADPASPDPVLRQSSRVVAAGAINTQSTYNLRRWPEILGAPDDWSRPGEVPGFYGFKTEEELDRAQTILADVDMLRLFTPDDAPVFMFTSQPGGPPRNRGHYLHHPDHARAVQKACAAVGVPATAWFALAEPRLEGDYLPALREFLFKYLRIEAKP